MIEGARRILYSQESHIEEAKDENANIFTRTTIEVNGILVKRAQEESYVSLRRSFSSDSQ